MCATFSKCIFNSLSDCSPFTSVAVCSHHATCYMHTCTGLKLLQSLTVIHKLICSHCSALHNLLLFRFTTAQWSQTYHCCSVSDWSGIHCNFAGSTGGRSDPGQDKEGEGSKAGRCPVGHLVNLQLTGLHTVHICVYSKHNKHNV